METFLYPAPAADILKTLITVVSDTFMAIKDRPEQLSVADFLKSKVNDPNIACEVYLNEPQFNSDASFVKSDDHIGCPIRDPDNFFDHIPTFHLAVKIPDLHSQVVTNDDFIYRGYFVICKKIEELDGISTELVAVSLNDASFFSKVPKMQMLTMHELTQVSDDVNEVHLMIVRPKDFIGKSLKSGINVSMEIDKSRFLLSKDQETAKKQLIRLNSTVSIAETISKSKNVTLKDFKEEIYDLIIKFYEKNKSNVHSHTFMLAMDESVKYNKQEMDFQTRMQQSISITYDKDAKSFILHDKLFNSNGNSSDAALFKANFMNVRDLVEIYKIEDLTKDPEDWFKLIDVTDLRMTSKERGTVLHLSSSLAIGFFEVHYPENLKKTQQVTIH